MLTDLIAETIEDVLQLHSRELQVIWNVTIEIGVLPNDPTGQRVIATFAFCAPSPVLGQVLWHVHLVPAEIAVDPAALDTVCRDACESIRSRRAQLLSLNNNNHKEG